MRDCECLHEHTDGVAGIVNLVLIVGSLPTISVIGVLLNLVNILVFSRQKETASKYLTALSCSDVGVCMAGILVICADSLRGYFFCVDQVFVFLLPKFIPLGLYFQMLSVYFTVLAAFDCFVSVYRGPSVAAARSSWAPRVLAYAVLTVAAYNIIQFGDLEALECTREDNVTLFELCPTDLRISDLYVVVYKGYMYALFMAFIPFVLLSLLTVGILTIMKSNQARQEKVKPSTGSAEGSPTVLLLVIVLFLCCNVTSLLVNVFEMMQIPLGDSNEAVLIDIGNFLVVINATANFFVYYFSSPDYKKTLCKMYRKYKTKRKSKALLRAAPEFL